jgi:hypothetical protein
MDALPHFNRVLSVKASGAAFAVSLLTTADQKLECTLDPVAAALLAQKFIIEAQALSSDQTGLIEVKGGFQLIWADTEPGIAIELAPNLVIPLVLGNEGIAALRECIAQLDTGIQSSDHH